MDRALPSTQWASIVALPITIVLHVFQGSQILGQPLVILMLAVPIAIGVYFNSSLAYWLHSRLGVEHGVAAHPV